MSDRTAPEDPVEAAMGGGPIIRREKVVARNLAVMCLLMFLFFGAASIAYARGWNPQVGPFLRWLTYFFVPFSAWIGLTKTVQRTLLTARELQVQIGFRSVHIPVASIASCRVMTAKDRPVRGREAFYPKGGDAILLDFQDDQGKERKLLIGSDDPAALVASIERARAAATTKVRVDAGAPDVETEAPLGEEEEIDDAKRAGR